MQRLTLYLMVGYPGSGKTTASKVIHDLTGATHLWADHERKALFTQPAYTHTENLKLYAELNDKADALLAEGKSVIYDTNFNFYKDREKLRAIAAKHDARAFVIWVTTPKGVARDRATKDAHKQDTRVLGDMPLEDFERMSRNLEEPRHTEHVITLDGTKISPRYVFEALHAAGA